MIASASRPGLVVFSDDWGRHPSSCQHLVSHLLTDFNTCWVNTIGLRAPSLNIATVKRGVEKIAQWTRMRSEAQDDESLVKHSTHVSQPQVLNPKMWPWFTRGIHQRFNWKLLERQLRPAIQQLPTPRIVVTTLPITAGLVGRLPVDGWVYYRVDDFGVWPGVGGRAMQKLDRQMVEVADCVISVSDVLRDQAQAWGRDSELLTHGVDVDFWQGSHAIEENILAECDQPVVLFWGVIDRRMDTEWLSALSKAMPNGTIALVGPEDNADPVISRLPNVRSFPPVAFERLPALAKQASVLLMPYADLPVTRAIQPLKLKEYLATGQPVVARNLPAVQPWADCLDAVNSTDEFVTAVLKRTQTGVTDPQRSSRERLVNESWHAKARQFSESLFQTLNAGQQPDTSVAATIANEGTAI